MAGTRTRTSKLTKLIITRGLPASGKTTFARSWVAEDRENRVRINRDDIRQMLDEGEFVKGVTEKRVLAARDALVRQFLGYGYEVVVDDTNLPMRTARDLRKLADKAGAEFEIMEFTDVDVDVCLAREQVRARANNTVALNHVILDMHERYLKGRDAWLQWPEEPSDSPKDVTPYSGTPGAPKAVIFDIDGTLAAHNGRDPFDVSLVYQDTLIEPIGDLAQTFHNLGYEVLFMSGRNDNSRFETHKWLADKLGMWAFNQPLFMRKAGDGRRDSVVKLELFDRHVRDRYDVKYAVDDRNQVVAECWRAMGITCLQCADGDF